MDLVDFRSQPDGEFQWVLEVKDHFSRHIWLFAIKNKSSLEVARCLKTWIAWCGHLKNFYSDNGKEFDGAVGDLLCQLVPFIDVIKGRPYHPQSQGSVEKSNDVFKDRLAALRSERNLPRDWVNLLPELQEVTNITPSCMLPRHTTPFEVWFGRKPHWISAGYGVNPDVE
jgi:transposase InsO family protein